MLRNSEIQAIILLGLLIGCASSRPAPQVVQLDLAPGYIPTTDGEPGDSPRVGDARSPIDTRAPADVQRMIVEALLNSHVTNFPGTGSPEVVTARFVQRREYPGSGPAFLELWTVRASGRMYQYWIGYTGKTRLDFHVTVVPPRKNGKAFDLPAVLDRQEREK